MASVSGEGLGRRVHTYQLGHLGGVEHQALAIIAVPAESQVGRWLLDNPPQADGDQASVDQVLEVGVVATTTVENIRGIEPMMMVEVGTRVHLIGIAR